MNYIKIEVSERTRKELDFLRMKTHIVYSYDDILKILIHYYLTEELKSELTGKEKKWKQ